MSLSKSFELTVFTKLGIKCIFYDFVEENNFYEAVKLTVASFIAV